MKKGDKIVVLKDCPRLDYNGNTNVVAWEGDKGEYIGLSNGTMHFCLVNKQCIKLRESEFEVIRFKIDPIVEDVVSKFRARSKKGIAKYGTTLEENDTDDFFEHLQEELMDAILYLQKLKKIRSKQLLTEIIQEDEKDGLYNSQDRGEEGFPKVSENVD
jgi:hypothetical protein